MNRQTSPSQTNQPYTNGHFETPLELSGVSLIPQSTVQKPTVFPSELPIRGLGPIFYALNRFELLGLPAFRYFSFICIVLTIISALSGFPGHWLVATLFALLWIGQLGFGLYFRQHHYINFTPAEPPHLEPLALASHEKLSIYATGLLSVEGRLLRFCALPGFARTFATGEHAILCRAQVRTWLKVLSWPENEIGMWYAFASPSQIQKLTWGTFTFGTTTMPGLCIDYTLELPPGPRRKRAELRQEALLLAAPDPRDAERLYADLLVNLAGN